MPVFLGTRPRVLVSLLPLLLSLAGTAALAQPLGGPMPPRERLTPEQRQKIFPDLRRLSLQDYRARIVILQRAESCINRATSEAMFSTCKRSEREAMGQQRRQHMGELQALYQRNGLPQPQWRRLEKRQGPAGGASAET